MISNGVVSLGVNPEGHLNAVTATERVGLRYQATGGDALIPGCYCEGWGVALPQTGLSGFASVDNGGVSDNLVVESFVADRTEATSVVRIGNSLRVTHHYHPSTDNRLYQVDLTVENIGSERRSDVVYRRAMDWDVPPTQFREYVTVQANSSQVIFSSNDGFASVDPLTGASDIDDYVGDFTDVGSFDHGALFDFDLGNTEPGAVNRFTMFYGAASDVTSGLYGLERVGSTGWSYAYPSVTGPTKGAPNTFLFGFQAADIRPNFLDWHPGDLHTHAAGDAGLGTNPHCDGLSDQQCAEKLVERVHTFAEAAGLDWVVLTEHVPWLGLSHRAYCPGTEFLPCQTFTNPFSWSRDQAERAWRRLDEVATAMSRVEGDVRLMLGQEFGNAAAVCGEAPQFRGFGHFGAYYVPEMGSDTQFDCDESDELTELDRRGGWGGINHPENGDGGGDWHCYHPGDREPGALSTCGEGLTDFGENRFDSVELKHDVTFRSIEVVNDNHLPTEATLDHWDELLNDGWLVGAVGGSDAHSAGRNSVGVLNEGNDGKLGLRGRTYAYTRGDIRPDGSFRAGAGSDPIRRALRTQRTIASNGPIAVPQVNGAGPGDAALFYGPSVRVRVDWPQDTFKTLTGPGEAEVDDLVVTRLDHTPDEVRVVIGKTTPAECPEQDRPCSLDLQVLDGFEPSAADIARGWMIIDVPIPAGWQHAYLRTEAMIGLRADPDGSFRDDEDYRYGSFSSPLYLDRVGADMSDLTYFDPYGTVVGVDGTPIVDAEVALEVVDPADGTTRPVRDGSTLLSAANRANPQFTEETGRFGWDVAAGTYRITARRHGCHAPGAAGQASVSTSPFTIPPQAPDVTLVLDCTPAAERPVRIHALLREAPDGELAFTYRTRCTRTDGSTFHLPDVRALAGSVVDTVAVPVGSSCVVTQSAAGVVALSGTSQDTSVTATAAEVWFYNTAAAGPAALAVSVDTDDGGLTGTAPVSVRCDNGVVAELSIAVGATAIVPSLTEGTVCETSIRWAGEIRPSRIDRQTTTVGAEGSAVRFHVERIACTRSGTVGPDVLLGTAGRDVICGGAGADVIFGFGGDDVILGGAGNDIIYTGPGADYVEAEGGDDLVIADAHDTVYGGPGRNTVIR